MKTVLILGVSLLFLVFSWKTYIAKTPVQYMANATEKPAIVNVVAYNHALAKAMVIFTLIFLGISLPLLLSDHLLSAFFFLLAMPFWSIGFMMTCMHIETKYSAEK